MTPELLVLESDFNSGVLFSDGGRSNTDNRLDTDVSAFEIESRPIGA